MPEKFVKMLRLIRKNAYVIYEWPLSNLNRQFLFRQTDVGSYKAEVAARFINKRVSGAEVIAHNCKIQDFDEDFYLQFHLIVCGLDSIVARRWINGMVKKHIVFLNV